MASGVEHSSKASGTTAESLNHENGQLANSKSDKARHSEPEWGTTGFKPQLCDPQDEGASIKAWQKLVDAECSKALIPKYLSRTSKAAVPSTEKKPRLGSRQRAPASAGTQRGEEAPELVAPEAPGPPRRLQFKHGQPIPPNSEQCKTRWYKRSSNLIYSDGIRTV